MNIYFTTDNTDNLKIRKNSPHFHVGRIKEKFVKSLWKKNNSHTNSSHMFVHWNYAKFTIIGRKNPHIRPTFTTTSTTLEIKLKKVPKAQLYSCEKVERQLWQFESSSRILKTTENRQPARLKDKIGQRKRTATALPSIRTYEQQAVLHTACLLHTFYAT